MRPLTAKDLKLVASVPAKWTAADFLKIHNRTLRRLAARGALETYTRDPQGNYGPAYRRPHPPHRLREKLVARLLERGFTTGGGHDEPTYALSRSGRFWSFHLTPIDVHYTMRESSFKDGYEARDVSYPAAMTLLNQSFV